MNTKVSGYDWYATKHPRYVLSISRLMPTESEPDFYFTRSQISIVKEAEALILSDLTRRIAAKELAERFGVSESSF